MGPWDAFSTRNHSLRDDGLIQIYTEHDIDACCLIKMWVYKIHTRQVLNDRRRQRSLRRYLQQAMVDSQGAPDVCSWGTVTTSSSSILVVYSLNRLIVVEENARTRIDAPFNCNSTTTVGKNGYVPGAQQCD